jgi:hypothetical protein
LFDRVQDRFTLAKNAGGMTDLLAIFGPAESDAEVLAEIVAYHPDRVTLLLADSDRDAVGQASSEADALRTRMAELMAAIEEGTGATVVGLAGTRSQLRGWRFDRELSPPLAAAA